MSDCGVCIDMCSDVENEFYVAKVIKARKEHKCCECKRVILPGEGYERSAGKSDGDMWNYATCPECLAVREVFVCGGWYFGCLWDSMEEAIFPILTTANECFAKLSPAAKVFTLKRWAKWKGLPV
jgi:hypothetical protein